MLSIDELLELTLTDTNTFTTERLWGPPTTPNAYGGQLVGLSLAAAFRTVNDNYIARSVHAQFLRSVDKLEPIVFKVQALNSGRRHTSRAVNGFQNNRLVMQTVCNLILQTPPVHQTSYGYQKPMPAVAAPGQDTNCPYFLDPQGYPNNFPVKVWVTELDSDLVTPKPPRQRMWLECPNRHKRREQEEQCIVAAYSDVHFTRVILRPYGMRIAPASEGLRKLLSIDHHIWFHHAADLSQRILVDSWCSRLSAGRGIVQSEMFAHDGRFVATAMQEGCVEIDAATQLPRAKL
ncbi:hypothetical protein H4S08_003131 [Coemansia sp. RSA 1365]|nr:hypothetical protein H4S08_003131 [Coemansia sp. RSA 1365]